MTYEEEMLIVARVIAATQKLAKAIEGDSIFPFEMLQALAEAKDAFEDALEVMGHLHPLRAQVKTHLRDTEILQRKLMIEM